MENLKNIKETLIGCVQAQMGNLQHADTHELGEAIDMIKDLSEAIYYCQIVKAMEENTQEHDDKKYVHYYYPIYDMQSRTGGNRMYYKDDYYPTNMPAHEGYKYIPEKMRNSMNDYPTEIRDYREGKSPINRRMYMESKELHKDEKTQRHELESYMTELTNDIMEMIEDATPEQKTILSQKLTTLAGKIN